MRRRTPDGYSERHSEGNIDPVSNPYPHIHIRSKSTLVEEDAYFLELLRYIHLNPVRAFGAREK